MTYFVHIAVGGPTYSITDAKGKVWCFEMHRRFGPSAVHKRTKDPLDKQPAEGSPFWHAVQLWIDQGEVVKDGMAQWIEPEPKPLWHISGRNYTESPKIAAETGARRVR